MALLAEAIRSAGERTGGLVDGTLVGALDEAGYGRTAPALAAAARARAAARVPPPSRGARSRGALAHARGRRAGWALRRPPGVLLDSGGLAKGLFADLLADELGAHASFAVDCAGDLRLGGTAGARPVAVASPVDGRTLHTFELAAGGVATSGIARRGWLDARGRPAHHILDPATGRPAFTGIVQATALAPTALDAEVRAKAALLSGPGRSRALAVARRFDRARRRQPPRDPGGLRSGRPGGGTRAGAPQGAADRRPGSPALAECRRGRAPRAYSSGRSASSTAWLPPSASDRRHASATALAA